MSERRTTSVTLGPSDPLPPTDTDWAVVDVISDDEVETRALADPDAQPLTDEQLALMRPLPSVKRLRERLGLTQQQFSTAFALPLGTVRDWEQGRKRPDAPARALLRVIEREPEMTRRSLVRSTANS